MPQPFTIETQPGGTPLATFDGAGNLNLAGQLTVGGAALGGQVLPGAAVQGSPFGNKPLLYAPTHLRRWRAALALADQNVVPLIYCGDSIPWGLGADNTTGTPNATALAKGICGRLQSQFGNSFRTFLQNPGEGYVFPNDSRVTVAGAPVQNLWAPTPFGQGYRLVGATQTLTITIPAGVTSITVIQGNMTQVFNAAGSNLADVTGQYNINGGGNTNLTALTNTNSPISTTIAVVAGNVFQVIGPAAAQTYITGFLLNSAAANGVQVHRICLNGAVTGSLLGGQASGILSQTAASQIIATRANYIWNAAPSLIIVEFSVNDQQFQNGGGTASQNGVTIGKYQNWMQQFCDQAVADGWCVLLVGGPQDQGYQPASPTLDQYLAVLKSIALATDHVAHVNISEMWGSYVNSQADGVQLIGSVHPNLAGHGDIAALLYDTLLGKAQAGITEPVPG